MSKNVVANMAGTVIEVLVKPGDTVSEGMDVVTLESMKMLQPVVAPSAGQVTAIHVAVGDFVNPDTPLAAIE